MTVILYGNNGQNKNHAEIRDQQAKVYKNPCFVFNSTLFEFLTAFSTAILTGSWWRRKLQQNRKSREPNELSDFQFQGNGMNSVASSVHLIIKSYF